MRIRSLAALLALALALAAAPAAAQRYAAPVGSRANGDTTVSFATGDVVRVTAYPNMESGVEVCGAVGPGMHWGKMLFARSDAEVNSALETVISFPTSTAAPSCSVHRAAGGESLVVVFSRAVKDEVGRIARLSVGQVVLPLGPLQGRRVTFTWVREGAFDVSSISPPPDTLGPPRP